MMTPYQRGCRDALLDVATQFDKIADGYEARAGETEKSAGFGSGRRNVLDLYTQDLRAETNFRRAADLCRALAQRLPDDPEESA